MSPLDTKILIKLIPLTPTTFHVFLEGGRWGGQPRPLVEYGKAWQTKTRGISKSILFGSGAVPGHSARAAGHSGEAL